MFDLCIANASINRFSGAFYTAGDGVCVKKQGRVSSVVVNVCPPTEFDVPRDANFVASGQLRQENGCHGFIPVDLLLASDYFMSGCWGVLIRVMFEGSGRPKGGTRKGVQSHRAEVVD